MNRDILIKIEDLQRRIEVTDISRIAKRVKEWGGADVIITNRLGANTERWLNDQPLVLGSQSTAPRRRAVITQYSKELSWLFIQLRKIFSYELDYVSKYDFYGSLAQSAIDYLEIDEEETDARSLLLAVLNSSKDFVQR